VALASVKSRSRWQSAVILSIEAQTPRIRSYLLAPAQPFGFLPGQHVKVRVSPSAGEQTSRSYSIASAPEAGAVIELAIEELPRGEVSGYFHRVASPGETIEIRGPLGDFVWTVRDGGPVLLIGGGSGLVPLMSMIRHRTLQRSKVSVGLILSAQTWDEVLFRDELLALAEARDGFELSLTVTREPARQAGVASRRVDREMVQEMLARLPAAPSGVFICGSDPFVENAERIVAALGIARGNLRTESYGV
jgi:ferredoxin-NADP reductase